MEIKQINYIALEKTYEAFIDAKELEEIKQKKLQEFAQEAKVQGFRPGKAPLNLVEGQYKSKIMPEVINEATTQAIDKIYEEGKLSTVSSPKVDISEFSDKGLTLVIKLELFPEVKDIDLAKITLQKTTIEVSDKEIDLSLKQMANYYKTFSDITEDRETMLGDTVVINFVGRMDGIAFEGGTGNDFPLELGSNMFIPGFEEQLVGKKVGEKVIVDVPFPTDYHAKNLAGKKSEFTVEILKIQAAKPSSIDDELAKKVGLKDLDELKNNIKERYQEQTEGLEKNNLKAALVLELKKTEDFQLPASLIKAEKNNLWNEFTHQKAHMQTHEKSGDYKSHNHNDEEIAFYKKSDEEIKQIQEKQAADRVKLGLILNHIARQESIIVKDEDIRAVLAKEAAMYGKDAEALIGHYKNDKAALKALQGKVMEDKILTFILGKINYKNKNISFEEYTAGLKT
ncbi:Trigger factor [Candidatus Hepatincolaceae symbiont of Richtersius coronifer]